MTEEQWMLILEALNALLDDDESYNLDIRKLINQIIIDQKYDINQNVLSFMKRKGIDYLANRAFIQKENP